MHSLTALADPTRRSIVEMLSAGELPAGEIAGRFEISAPAISQHLKVLKAAGLVCVRVDAQRRVYRLDPVGFGELDNWLRDIKRFWGGRLDALEQRLRSADNASKGAAPGRSTATRRRRAT